MMYSYIQDVTCIVIMNHALLKMNKQIMILILVGLAMVVMVPSGLGTTLILQDANTENLDDSVLNRIGDGFSGASATYDFENRTDDTSYKTIIIKFNISSIPADQIIDSAHLSMYFESTTLDSGDGLGMRIHHVYAFPTFSIDSGVEWKEGNGNSSCDPGEICWSKRPSSSDDYNINPESTVVYTNGDPLSVFYNWTTTEMVRTAYIGGDTNITMLFHVYISSGNTDLDRIRLTSKEGATSANRPMLTINYSPAAAPTFSTNSTNSTVAGQEILHRLKWEDNVGLSGYIFSYCNGTWDGSDCLGSTEGTYTEVHWDTGTGRDDPKGITNNGTHIFTCDNADDEVYIYLLDGTYVTSWDISTKSGDCSDITNNGSNVFIIDTNDRNVYVYTMSGSYVTEWATELQAGFSQHGLTTDGINIWITDYTTDIVYEYYMNGTYTSTSWTTITAERGDLGSNGNSEGMTTDGTNIWTYDGADMLVYKYDMDGNVISSWDTSGEVADNTGSGITNNGTYFWIVDGTGDEVYQYEMTTTGWVNDSFVAMTGTLNWSNITKTINSTIGLTYAWRVYANDTSNNWNTSDIYTYVSTSGEAPPAAAPIKTKFTMYRNMFTMYGSRFVMT